MEQARGVIRTAAPGIYELSKLYGPKWLSIDNPTGFGMRFKRSVELGHLDRIGLVGKTSSNHWQYLIH